MTTLTSLSSKIGRLRQLAQATSFEGGRDVSDRLNEANLQFCRVRLALKEGQEAVTRHRQLEGNPVSPADVAVLQELALELSDLIPRLDDACLLARQSQYYVFSTGKWSPPGSEILLI